MEACVLHSIFRGGILSQNSSATIVAAEGGNKCRKMPKISAHFSNCMVSTCMLQHTMQNFSGDLPIQWNKASTFLETCN